MSNENPWTEILRRVDYGDVPNPRKRNRSNDSSSSYCIDSMFCTEIGGLSIEIPSIRPSKRRRLCMKFGTRYTAINSENSFQSLVNNSSFQIELVAVQVAPDVLQMDGSSPLNNSNTVLEMLAPLLTPDSSRFKGFHISPLPMESL